MPKKSKSQTAADAEMANKKRKQSHVSPLLEASLGDEKKEKTKRQHRQKQKSKQALKEEAEERRLTALLFGGSVEEEFHQNYGTNDNPKLLQENVDKEAPNSGNRKENEEQGASSDILFEIDRTGVDDGKDSQDGKEGTTSPTQFQQARKTSERDDDDSDDEDDDNESENGQQNQDKPAWVDDDDDEVQVDLLATDRLRKLRKYREEDTTSKPLKGSELEQRLRARYKSTMQATAQTDWARLDDGRDRKGTDDEEEDDEAAELKFSSQPLLAQGGGSTTRLPPNILNVMRCPDANQVDYNQSVVQAVNFHPGSDPDKPLMLTAGLDKTLRFFQVGTEKSEKIHGIHCKSASASAYSLWLLFIIFNVVYKSCSLDGVFLSIQFQNYLFTVLTS